MAQLRAMVDKLLTDVSNGLFQELMSFAAERFLTPMGVVQQSGKIGAYGTNHLRIHANAMGGRGEAPRVSLHQPNLSQTYYIEDHGLEDVVTPNDYRNFELPFDAEKDKTLLLSYANLVAKEAGLATACGSSAGTLTQNTTLSGTSQFSDYDNSDPVGVIKTARKTVRDACGYWPTKVLLEADVAETLSFHPQLWDRLGYKYNQSGQLTNQDLARAFKVAEVVVAEAMYDSSSEGQTASLAPLWSKMMIFANIATNPALRQKTLGYHVFYKNTGPRKTYKYAVQNPPESTAIICKDDYDMLLSDVTCAYAVYSAIA